MIKTFGANKKTKQTCDVVEVGMIAKDGEVMILTTLVVPTVCDPICCQPVSLIQSTYDYLSGLELADSSEFGDNLAIDILIGADHYWTLVSG